MKAVPAMNHAKGRRYHGLMLIKYKLAETEVNVVRTAPQALAIFSWNTCRSMQQVTCEILVFIQGAVNCVRSQQPTSGGMDLTMSVSVTPSGNSAPMVL